MKKNILGFYFTILLGVLSNAQEKYTLTIDIEGLNDNSGNVLVGLFDNEKDFLTKEYLGKKTIIKNKKATVIFNNIPKGTYGVGVIHDKNMNGKIDKNMIGLPKEPYNVSNNAKRMMAAPKYNDAKFELYNNKTIKINLK